MNHQVDYYSQDREYVCSTCGFTTTDRYQSELHRFAPLPGTEPTPEVQELKTCPDCAEEVRAVARKCPYCGHMFEEPAAPLSS